MKAWQIRIAPTLPILSHQIAEQFVQLTNACVEKKHACHVAFSGGRTPQLFYALLATEPYKSQIPWQKIYFYQTDERYVPHTHRENNFAMFEKQLFCHLSLPTRHYLRIQTERTSPVEAAEHYAGVLQTMLPKNDLGYPQFDFMLLGVGTDGHIASLFPNTQTLFVTDKLVVSAFIESLQAWRVSLTLPVLNQAKQLVILVSGVDKAPIIRHLFQQSAELIYPVQMLQPCGKIEWYMDVLAVKEMFFLSRNSRN